MVRVCQRAANRGRGKSDPPRGQQGPALRQRRLEEQNGKEAWLGIDVARAWKAQENSRDSDALIKQRLGDSVMISDAFFPFPDNIHNAAEAGIRFIVQPGGSKRDDEVISACDEYGIAMALMGMRHFKH